MRKHILIFIFLFLVGCTYKGQNLETYLDNPGTIVQDPHFAQYQEKRDELESQYLKKKITYAEYIEQRNKLDDMYAKEVKERDNKINSPDL